MAQLFTSIEDLKLYVGGSVENNIDLFESIEADIEAAINAHLRPLVGDALIDTLIEAYPDLAENQEDVCVLLQKAVAPLAVYEASFTKNIVLSDKGLTRNEVVPFKYQENQYRAALLNRGYDAIEALLKYLDNDSSWEFRAEHRASMLRYASDFRRASAFRISRYTFEHLRPIIDKVEYATSKLLPKQFYNALKNKEFDNTITAQEKQCIKLMHRVIAAFTVYEAVKMMRIRIEGSQIFEASNSEDSTGIESRKPVPYTVEERYYTHSELANDIDVQRLIEYVNANKTAFPLAFSTAAGGTNSDTDAFGYIAPAKTDAELEAEAAALETLKTKQVFRF